MLLAAIATVVCTFFMMFVAIWIGDQSVPEKIQGKLQQVMERMQ